MPRVDGNQIPEPRQRSTESDRDACADARLGGIAATGGARHRRSQSLLWRVFFEPRAGGTDVDLRDFLARAELLAACGMTVLISDYFEYYRLAAYLAWRTKERIGVVMGLPSVAELFDEKYYAGLPGGTLESFGRLFKNDLKIYVYPLQRHAGDGLETIHTFKVKPELQPLYDYLVGRGSFVQLDNFNPKYLPIFSRDVLKRIASGDETWDEMVPPQVAEIIRQRGFFGYKKKK